MVTEIFRDKTLENMRGENCKGDGRMFPLPTGGGW